MAATVRFVVFVVVSVFVFIAALLAATRSRARRPWSRILALAFVIVVGGMIFARWGQNIGLSWAIYYTVPALLTFVGPPFVLRMAKREVVTYLLLAVLMAPAIHLFFSFFIGWHDYMPFFRVPSASDLFGAGVVVNPGVAGLVDNVPGIEPRVGRQGDRRPTTRTEEHS